MTSSLNCKIILLNLNVVYKPLIDQNSHDALYQNCQVGSFTYSEQKYCDHGLIFKIRIKNTFQQTNIVADQVLKIEIPRDYVLEFPDNKVKLISFKFRRLRSSKSVFTFLQQYYKLYNGLVLALTRSLTYINDFQLKYKLLDTLCRSAHNHQTRACKRL